MNLKGTTGQAIFAPIRGLLLSYGTTVLVFTVYALLLTYTDISEKSTYAVVLATLVISLIIGGIGAAGGAKRRGLIWGGLTGILYVLVMVLLGVYLIPDYALGSKTLVCLLLAISSGGLGGIIGVNLIR
jgi:putative membrane protein (TIGR04086 family)